MSSSRIGSGFGRPIGALILAAALVCGLTPASAAPARSSPEDLQRFVSIARTLEQTPLKADARDDRAWALEWLTNAPDVTVDICLYALGRIEKNYPYAGEITLQDMFSMAAFVIEHPETANDQTAQHLAGIEGALNAYRSILRDRPEAKSTALETLLQIQSRGELSDRIRRALDRCAREN